MIVSWNWLTHYVRLDMSVETLAERFALTGLNHESTEDVGGDLAIDLEVTSNRPDCLGHLGVAREVSVLFDRPLTIPNPSPAVAGKPVEELTSISVEEPDLCPKFTARVISGVKVAESPWWLRKRLETLGVRPISNLVDITNYVMFECGQPLHAYDLDALAEHRLIVRRVREKETLKAINGKTYELTRDMLVIADALRPVGLAGVMGGLDTEISASTKNVLIEAARFDALSIRKTARALGLFSPSSYRFERPIDPEITEWASRRCVELILETAGGTLHPGLIDIGQPVAARPPVTLRLDQIERVLGIAIDRETSDRILRALGMLPVSSTSTTLTYQAPSWRSDLDREIDLIEEVARVHGYENIPENRAVPLTSAPRGVRERVEAETRVVLTAVGIDEAVTFSLVEEKLAVPIGTEPVLPPVRVEHSSRRKESALRRSLTPSLLAARRHNEAHGNSNAEFFEIADVYLPRSGDELPDQPTRLAIVTGRDFLGLKGIVETLIRRLHIKERAEFRAVELEGFRPGRTSEVLIGSTLLGYLGEVDETWRASLELRGESSAAELEFSVLQKLAVLVPQHQPLPSFPAVGRDLSLVVARSLPWGDLAATVREICGKTLESVDFLDTFAGGNIPPEKHSVHFGLQFRDPSRTLTGEEVDRAVKSVIEACGVRFGASLRA